MGPTCRNSSDVRPQCVTEALESHPERRSRLRQYSCERAASIRHPRQENEAPHRTIRRHSDEPRLELGAKVALKDGVIGVVLARFIPSRRPNEVHYVVEVRSEAPEDK